jgi:endoglucanase
MVKKTAEAWQLIVSRYAKCSTIAAYDLMNEPMGAPDCETLHQVHDVFYKAIRKVDSRHIIIIEDGYKSIKHIPQVKKMGWDNIVLSTHTYGSKADSEEDCIKGFEEHVQIASMEQDRQDVPYYLGEFNVDPSFNVNALLAKFITQLQQKNSSWSVWTYKLGGRCPRSRSWGLYGTPRKLEKIDPFHDSEGKIFKKIKKLRTEKFVKNEELFEVFRKTTMK